MTIATSIVSAVTAVAGLCLLGSQTALAQPMKCSGEQKACIANCNKSPHRAATSACVTDCGARQVMCVRTGCWDNGTQRYCGLARQ